MPSSPSSARWTYAFAGALLAAAMIAAVFLVFDPIDRDQGSKRSPVTATPTPTSSSGRDEKAKDTTKDKTREKPGRTASPAAEPSKQGEPAGDQGVAAVYYVGDTPAGPRLFREFRRIRGTSALDRAVNGLQAEPLDPDYVRTWSPGSIKSIDDNDADGLVQVSLTSSRLRMIPGGMSETQATAAVQSLVYTVQGAVQARAEVAFVLDGEPVDQVYGVETSRPLTNRSPLATLNLVSVTTPEQGSRQAETMRISGVGNSFEASIGWQIQTADGRVVKRGSTTSEGWLADRLYPWSDTVNLGKLPSGDYLFTANTDDPSGGTEGSGPAADTKRFTIG